MWHQAFSRGGGGGGVKGRGTQEKGVSYLPRELSMTSIKPKTPHRLKLRIAFAFRFRLSTIVFDR